MKQTDKRKEGTGLLAVLQKTINASCFSESLYPLLFEYVNDQKQQLELLYEREQKHYQLLQYIHFLINGAYYQHEKCQVSYHSADKVIHTALLNEIKKMNWCYELLTGLAGTKKRVIMQALQHSLDCAKTFVGMLEEVNAEQIRSAHEMHE
jgi:hypothetical protein